MKKVLVKLENYKIEEFSVGIRSKTGLISIILKVINFIIIEKINVRKTKKYDTNYIEVFIDTFSRVFIFLEKKIYSMNFPFQLRIEEDAFSVYVKNVHINSSWLNALQAFFLHLEERDIDSDNVSEEIKLVMDEFNIQKKEYNLFKIVVGELLVYEPGYLRYDLDEREIKNHPLHHIDVFYSNATTFKMKTKKMTAADIKDLLSVDSAPWVLSK